MNIRVKSPEKKLTNVTYDSLAELIRATTGKKRLSPTEVAEVRAAVQRHRDRQAAPTHPEERGGRFLQMYREKVAKRIRGLFFRHYRTPSGRWVGGEVDIDVHFAPRWQDVFGGSDTFVTWHKRHAWQGRNLDVCLTVHEDWERTVESEGIATAGGMLTLAAQRVSDGVWHAKWLRQGRGFEVITEKGYIARAADGSYAHAKTLDAALRLARQRVAQGREITQIYEHLKTLAPAEIAERYGHIRVSVADSIRGGNCKSGTHHWIERYAGGRTKGTIDELLQIARAPGYHVLRAIAAAVARHESEAAVSQ